MTTEDIKASFLDLSQSGKSSTTSANSEEGGESLFTSLLKDNISKLKLDGKDVLDDKKVIDPKLLDGKETTKELLKHLDKNGKEIDLAENKDKKTADIKTNGSKISLLDKILFDAKNKLDTKDLKEQTDTKDIKNKDAKEANLPNLKEEITKIVSKQVDKVIKDKSINIEDIKNKDTKEPNLPNLKEEIKSDKAKQLNETIKTDITDKKEETKSVEIKVSKSETTNQIDIKNRVEDIEKVSKKDENSDEIKDKKALGSLLDRLIQKAKDDAENVDTQKVEESKTTSLYDIQMRSLEAKGDDKIVQVTKEELKLKKEPLEENIKSIKVEEKELLKQNTKDIKVDKQEIVEKKIKEKVEEKELLKQNTKDIKIDKKEIIENSPKDIKIEKNEPELTLSLKDEEEFKLTEDVKEVQENKISSSDDKISIKDLRESVNDAKVVAVEQSKVEQESKTTKKEQKTSLMDILVQRNKQSIEAEEENASRLEKDIENEKEFRTTSYLNAQKSAINTKALFNKYEAVRIAQEANSLEDVKKSAELLDLGLKDLDVKKAISNIQKLDMSAVTSSNLLDNMAFRRNIGEEIRPLIYASTQATKALIEDTIHIPEDIDIRLNIENTNQVIHNKIFDAKQQMSQMMSDVAKQMYENYKPPVTAFRINLHPSTLGTIAILMKTTGRDRSLSITMSATKTTTLEALIEGENALQKALSGTFDENTQFSLDFNSSSQDDRESRQEQTAQKEENFVNEQLSTQNIIDEKVQNSKSQYNSLDYI